VARGRFDFKKSASVCFAFLALTERHMNLPRFRHLKPAILAPAKLQSISGALYKDIERLEFHFCLSTRMVRLRTVIAVAIE